MADAGGVPTLTDLRLQRSDWWLARSPEWRKHGGYERPVSSPWHVAAYEAVRAGVSIYLQILRDPDRNLRLGVAQLLRQFPPIAWLVGGPDGAGDWPTVSPVLAEQLSVETDLEVAAAMCLVAGVAGQPSDGLIVGAVSRWRDHPDRSVHRAALVGLVRLRPAPDTELLAELIGLPDNPLIKERPRVATTLAYATETALGGLSGESVPQLAGLLLERIRVPGLARWDFFALRLLLGLTFPDGPLPDGASFTDLSDAQQEVVHLVLHADLLRQGVEVQRAIGECNLPYTEEALAAWYAGNPLSADERDPRRTSEYWWHR
jgi:hypothetical protein